MLQGPVIMERRRDPRYQAAEGVILLLAWRDGDGTRGASALLLDVSRGGALLVVDGCPADLRAVRVCLEEGLEDAWIGADVVEVEINPQGRHRVRLAFCEPCPEAFLVAVTRCVLA